MDFNALYDESDLPRVLGYAKTLSKKECFGIFEYMQKHKPVNILEFGVQYGCSTAVFLETAKWLGYNINLHSWDIRDQVKCVDKKRFSFHIEDITGKEELILKYSPDLVFLDAHPYALTKKIVEICLDKKINFMCHDVSMEVHNATKNASNNFTNRSPSINIAWELYILSEVISSKILTDDYYENDKLVVRCIRDLYGLAIIEHK